MPMFIFPRSRRAGRQAEDPENKLRLLAGRQEANHQLMKAYQTYLAGLSLSVGRSETFRS
jgi:hypothetical protein